MLRRRFPQLAIIVTNDTNGSFNYLPPKSYYGNGAYEQDCADFGPGCLERVIEAAATATENGGVTARSRRTEARRFGFSGS